MIVAVLLAVSVVPASKESGRFAADCNARSLGYLDLRARLRCLPLGSTRRQRWLKTEPLTGLGRIDAARGRRILLGKIMPPRRMGDVRQISEQLFIPNKLILIHGNLLCAVERRQRRQVPRIILIVLSSVKNSAPTRCGAAVPACAPSRG